MGPRSAVSTRKGGGFYGYKLQLAACTRTGLPLAWRIETARRNDSLYVAPLLDAVRARGYDPETVAMDRGYDNNRVYDECHARGIAPVIPLRKGRIQPETPIKRGTPEWGDLYRRRTAVEREFGRLKHDYGLAFLRVRGLERVRLHAEPVHPRASRVGADARASRTARRLAAACGESEHWYPKRRERDPSREPGCRIAAVVTRRRAAQRRGRKELRVHCAGLK